MKHLLFLLICLFSPLLQAQDFSAVDRTILKEPKYSTKRPHYCMLMLEKDLQTPIWMVLDGPQLYIDLNRNKDLTDDGEHIELYQRRCETQIHAIGDTTEYTLSLTLHNYSLVLLYFINRHTGLRWFTAPSFSPDKSEAPIICFGFNRSIVPDRVPDEMIPGKAYEVRAHVLTRGFRSKTFLGRHYTLPREGVPDFPTATLALNNHSPDRVSVKLMERC